MANALKLVLLRVTRRSHLCWVDLLARRRHETEGSWRVATGWRLIGLRRETLTLVELLTQLLLREPLLELQLSLDGLRLSHRTASPVSCDV